MKPLEFLSVRISTTSLHFYLVNIGRIEFCLTLAKDGKIKQVVMYFHSFFVVNSDIASSESWQLPCFFSGLSTSHSLPALHFHLVSRRVFVTTFFIFPNNLLRDFEIFSYNFGGDLLCTINTCCYFELSIETMISKQKMRVSFSRQQLSLVNQTAKNVYFSVCCVMK